MRRSEARGPIEGREAPRADRSGDERSEVEKHIRRWTGQAGTGGARRAQHRRTRTERAGAGQHQQNTDRAVPRGTSTARTRSLTIFVHLFKSQGTKNRSPRPKLSHASPPTYTVPPGGSEKSLSRFVDLTRCGIDLAGGHTPSQTHETDCPIVRVEPDRANPNPNRTVQDSGLAALRHGPCRGPAAPRYTRSDLPHRTAPRPSPQRVKPSPRRINPSSLIYST